MTNLADDKSRMRLVGRLVRSYREDSVHGGGTLSPDALLYLMSAHKDISEEGYSVKYDSGDLSRWENGKSPVPREFLQNFCTALEISQPEVDDMLSLVGGETVSEERVSDAKPFIGMTRGLIGKVVPTGGYTSLGGFSFSLLGLDGTESLLAYAGGFLALMTGLGVWHWRKSGKSDEVIHDLFFVSLLFLLNTPLLLGAVTRVDPYGLFALPVFEVGALLFALVIIVNLSLSLMAWSFFNYLRRRLLEEENRRRLNPYIRSFGITFLPIVLVYAFILVFSNLGGWMYYLVILGTLLGAFTVILAFNDPDVRWDESKAKWAPPVVVQVIVVLCVFGVAGMLVTYLEPSLIVDTARSNLLWSWESGFASLGYPEDELIERFRVGVVWMSLAAIAYLATIIGSYLVVTVRRSAGDAASN